MTETSELNDFNAAIVDEFRANEGKVGGPFEGGTLLLLHTTGAKCKPRLSAGVSDDRRSDRSSWAPTPVGPRIRRGCTTCGPIRGPHIEVGTDAYDVTDHELPIDERNETLVRRSPRWRRRSGSYQAEHQSRHPAVRADAGVARPQIADGARRSGRGSARRRSPGRPIVIEVWVCPRARMCPSELLPLRAPPRKHHPRRAGDRTRRDHDRGRQPGQVVGEQGRSRGSVRSAASA